jgi:phage tail tape-measure protein
MSRQLNKTGEIAMRKSIIALALASTVTLGACASTPQNGDIAQGAAIGAAGGAAVGAVAPGIGVIEGAAVGAAIGGLAGAVWADQNNDGYVDGYVSNGQYYAGTPQGYDPTLHRVATGALGGAALGAAAGAVIPGVSVLEGAVVGAAVGGLAGAIWADRDNDGRVDGYVQNGQYYAGAPASTAPAPAPMAPAPTRSGERG